MFYRIRNLYNNYLFIKCCGEGAFYCLFMKQQLQKAVTKVPNKREVFETIASPNFDRGFVFNPSNNLAFSIKREEDGAVMLNRLDLQTIEDLLEEAEVSVHGE